MPYAFVENNSVIEVLDSLPANWRNISNFYVLSNNPEYLKSLGWYVVNEFKPSYDSSSQKLDNWRYTFDGIKVNRIADIVDLPKPSLEDIERSKLERVNTKWQEIRIQRDELMKAFEWRYTRYERQVRLGMPPTDNINDLDSYMQGLADITLQSDPDNIAWPNFSNS